MEDINGVSFRDFACASANIVGGMTLEKACEVLGIELPIWESTSEAWANKMAELTPEDMNFYASVFTNPKQGKFANVEGGAEGPEVVLAKYPEWSDTIKMQKYMEHASAVGIDIDFEKEFDITLTQYSQLAMHWSAYYKEKVVDVANQNSREMLDKVAFSEAQVEKHRVGTLFDDLNNKWSAYYAEKFQDKNADISEDIDF